MRWIRGRLLWLVILIEWLVPATGYALDCSGAAPIKDPGVCFADYVPRGSRPVDLRIETWLAHATPAGAPIRSFAFVISIGNYPALPPGDRVLDAVNVDLTNLIQFLKEQQFDEIIVLRDGDATGDNIQKVFNYLLSQVPLYRSRFLFAYDGHGTKPPAQGIPGGLALSTSTGDGDVEPSRSFDLSVLQERLTKVATFAYQSVALLGSCYSGGIFPISVAQGENFIFAGGSGAHAVTATDAFSLAWTSGPGMGTIFFDKFISKVRTNQPDEDDASAPKIVDASGAVHIGPHIVRLGLVVDLINIALSPPRENPVTNHPYPQLLMGPIAPLKADQGGAFFFLGYQQLQSAGEPAKIVRNPDEIWGGPNSIFRNAGEIFRNTTVPILFPQPVTFLLPESYKIRGVDLSQQNGEVDFRALRDAELRFVYLKATEGRHKDSMFAHNWAAARQAGLAVGAYHEFMLCGVADEQFEAIRAVVPKLADSLPIALAIEPSFPPESQACPVEFTRQAMGDLARKLAEYYGKMPIIYGNSPTLSRFVDETLAQFPIWLAKFSTKGIEAPKFLGNNPWTLWQVTERAKFAGVAGRLDLNLFYGSDDEFNAFAVGAGNVARNTVGPPAQVLSPGQSGPR